MSEPKYKKQYNEMIENNKELFDQLKNSDKNSDLFKETQKKLLRIIRRYEDGLCKKTENTRYNGFSVSLGDKFMEQVRTYYPEIDFV